MATLSFLRCAKAMRLGRLGGVMLRCVNQITQVWHRYVIANLFTILFCGLYTNLQCNIPIVRVCICI